MFNIGIRETSRKAIHIFNIIIPLSHIYIFKNKIDMIIFLSAMVIFCFFIEILRNQNSFISKIFQKYLFYMMRSFEKQGSLTGSTWVFVGALVTIILVPRPFCLLALFFLAFGDTLAALVGMKFPFMKIGSKTLSGSLACFIVCLLIGLIFNFEISLEIILIGAFAATIAELISIKINDNISIPLLSGCAMYLGDIVV
tara:strand:- start:110 stop:703 length:594 start_codon:yes stop_codon:yes gene_type:complete